MPNTPVTAIEPGDGAVVLTLSEPFAALPAYLAHYSAQILAPASYDQGGAGVEVIGTGPYRITDLAPPRPEGRSLRGSPGLHRMCPRSAILPSAESKAVR